MHFFYRHGKGERRDDAAGPATGAELAFIRGLHVGTIKTVATDSGVTLEGYEPGMDVGGVELKGSGITAVAFVPGRKATVVTVGADGRCCVVDFTQPSKHKAVLLKSWHIRRPATSVSIICSAHRASPTQLDGADDMAPAKTNNPPNGAYYVAVGRADGRVLLFDLDGKPLGEQALDEDGARVIDVEWTQVTNDASIPQKNNRSGIRRSPAAKLRRKSLESSVLSHGRPSQLRVMAEPAEDPLFDFSTPRKALGAFPWEPPSNESTVAALESPQTVESAPASSDTGITSKDSNEKPHHISQTSSYTTPRRQTGGYQVVESATISSEFLPDDVSSERLPPPLPPRPTPKPGGRLSVRRAQTADQTALNNASYLSISAKARRVSAGNPRLSKGVAIANRPTKSQVLFGPRKAPNPVTDTFKSHSGSSNIQVSSEQPEDAWFDISPEPPRLQAETSPQSSDATTKSFKTASSHLDTSSSPDRSDDTVVDWSAGLSQQVPTLHVTHPSGERPFNQKPKKKGHISLSVSSASDLTFTPSFSNPDDTKHPVIPSPAGSPRRHLPSLPSIRPNEDMSPLKTQSKQKGHVGLSEFSDTNKTVTPLSSGSDGPIVQWPSLKKSPRIPELNKGIPNPVKYAPPSSPPVKESMEESVTGLILEGYIAAPSPPKPPKPAPKPIVEPGSKSSSCTCSETMEATLNDSLGDLRAEIKRQFEAQKIWLEDLMKGEEESRMILVEENRWLRDELARIEKEKCQGKRKGPSGM